MLAKLMLLLLKHFTSSAKIHQMYHISMRIKRYKSTGYYASLGIIEKRISFNLETYWDIFPMDESHTYLALPGNKDVMMSGSYFF